MKTTITFYLYYLQCLRFVHRMLWLFPGGNALRSSGDERMLTSFLTNNALPTGSLVQGTVLL
jgi:hypothetical protein